MSDERETLLDVIDAQREQLRALEEDERQISGLRAREAELEVEVLLAEAAVRTGLQRGRPDIPAREASAITALRRRLRRLETGLARREAPQGTEQVQLRAAADALSAWLEAPGVVDSGRAQLIARIVVLVLTGVAVWAAIAVHPAFLLLLFPIVAPLTLLFRGGDNPSWRRHGARRRFEQTGLAGPAAWTEVEVGRRSSELREIAERAVPDADRDGDSDPDPDPDPGCDLESHTDDADLEAELETHERELAARLAEIGEDALTPKLESWLETLSRAERARRDLAHVRRTRESIASRSGAVREGVFRFLARHGAAPPGGGADAGALAAGLERVRRETAQ